MGVESLGSEHAGDAIEVVGVDELDRVPADDLVSGPAHEIGHGGTDPQDLHRFVGECGHVGHALCQPGRQPVDRPVHRGQWLTARPSRDSANFSNAAARRVGTCSIDGSLGR